MNQVNSISNTNGVESITRLSLKFFFSDTVYPLNLRDNDSTCFPILSSRVKDYSIVLLFSYQYTSRTRILQDYFRYFILIYFNRNLKYFSS